MAKKKKLPIVFQAEPAPSDYLGGLIVRLTFDPWIGMVVVGALGHHLNNAAMMHFSFVEALLVILIITSFTPSRISKWNIRGRL